MQYKKRTEIYFVSCRKYLFFNNKQMFNLSQNLLIIVNFFHLLCIYESHFLVCAKINTRKFI